MADLYLVCYTYYLFIICNTVHFVDDQYFGHDGQVLSTK